jgi:hypothetical protein
LPVSGVNRYQESPHLRALWSIGRRRVSKRRLVGREDFDSKHKHHLLLASIEASSDQSRQESPSLESRDFLAFFLAFPHRPPLIFIRVLLALTISPKVIRSLAGRVLRLPDLALTAL